MNAEEVIDQFRTTGALLEGHFQLTSGLHSTVYLQCALVLQHPQKAEAFGRAIAESIAGRDSASGVTCDWWDRYWSRSRARVGGEICLDRTRVRTDDLRRGFTVAPGEKTLVVEDVITTGGSTRETIDVLRQAGADVVAAASIIDRSGGSVDVSVPRTALATLKVLSVDPSVCDACKLGEQAVKPGSRKATP